MFYRSCDMGLYLHTAELIRKQETFEDEIITPRMYLSTSS